MFSDIKKKSEKDIKAPKVVKVKKELSCPPGMTCFEDYSANQNSFQKIFDALSQTEKTGNKTRIAIFGDSFIEGDVMCGDFRNLLQQKFGGEGVGIVPLTAETSHFRQTIKEDFTGFTSYNIVKNPKEIIPYPPFGWCSVPEEGNSSSFYATDFSAKTKALPSSRLFYQALNNANLTYTSNNISKEITLSRGENIQTQNLDYPTTQKLKLQFSADKNLFLYGLSFEGNKGIYVDNFGLRGNSGTGLLSSKDDMHKALNDIQDYKLIILQYGLNATSEKNINLDWYMKAIRKMVQKVKAMYPNATILMLSVSDRSHRVNGNYETMPSVKAMVETQRAVAAENKIAFWDLFSAMGGENSMPKYVNSKPPKANKDYTHLNFLGGKDIAKLLYDTLMFEYEKYKAK